MTIRNTKNSYGSVSKFFHWFIAILIIIMLIVGFVMEDVSKSYQPLIIMLHKSTGLLILLLVGLRLAWRWINITPDLPAAIPAWQRLAAHLVHYLLYLLLIAMPLSGWIMSTASGKAPVFYNLVTLPFPGIPHSKAWGKFFFELHSLFAWTIIVVISLHLLGALKHYFVNKDNVLQRMLPFK